MAAREPPVALGTGTAEDEMVPVKLVWTRSGEAVSVTGTFAGWGAGTPLKRDADGVLSEQHRTKACVAG